MEAIQQAIQWVQRWVQTHFVPKNAVATESRGVPDRYRLISADVPLGDWIVQDTLARFTGAELGAFGSDYRLAQTWSAVKDTTVELTFDLIPGHSSGQGQVVVALAGAVEEVEGYVASFRLP